MNSQSAKVRECVGLSDEVSLNLLRDVMDATGEGREPDQCSCCGSTTPQAAAYVAIVHRINSESSHSRRLIEAVNAIIGSLEFSDEKRILVADTFLGHGLTHLERAPAFRKLKDNGFNCIMAVSYSRDMISELRLCGLKIYTISPYAYAQLAKGVIRLIRAELPNSPTLIFAYTDPKDPHHAICLFADQCS